MGGDCKTFFSQVIGRYEGGFSAIAPWEGTESSSKADSSATWVRFSAIAPWEGTASSFQAGTTACNACVSAPSPPGRGLHERKARGRLPNLVVFQRHRPRGRRDKVHEYHHPLPILALSRD